MGGFSCRASQYAVAGASAVTVVGTSVYSVKYGLIPSLCAHV